MGWNLRRALAAIFLLAVSAFGVDARAGGEVVVLPFAGPQGGACRAQVLRIVAKDRTHEASDALAKKFVGDSRGPSLDDWNGLERWMRSRAAAMPGASFAVVAQ